MWMLVSVWTVDGDQPSAAFGAAVERAGDVNGDGFGDVIVGAPFFDGGDNDEGRAFVYLGGVAGLDVAPAWRDSPTGASGANFGNSVASAGDVNGDGFDDVIVGAPYVVNGQSDEGQVFVYHGSALGLSTTADWTVESNDNGARLGTDVAAAGDVNGDGFDDVIVSAPYFTAGQSDEGRAFLYLGSAAGLQTDPAWTAEPDQELALFGASVSSAGDVNGDGFDDVIVGIPFWENGEYLEGAAWVYLGSAAGLAPTPVWTTESDQDSAQLGLTVASAGDVNGDGFGDVVVGTSSWDNGDINEGAAWVYHGSAAGLSATPDWTAEGDQLLAFLGVGVSAAGDMNGDGFGDLAVGVWGYDGDLPDEGRFDVYTGSAAGLSAMATMTAEGNQSPVTYFASSLASVGDVNGDGFDDLIVGASAYEDGQTDEGAAFVYAGGCADALDSDGDTVGDACDQCVGFDDFLDTDLDGVADGCDVCPTVADPNQEDDDADGLGDACDDCPLSVPDVDGDGVCATLDCDDADSTTFPGAPQVCDGVDNTCGAAVPTDELDTDEDGAMPCGGDCDDTDPNAAPTLLEVCDDGIDNDCVGGDQECTDVGGPPVEPPVEPPNLAPTELSASSSDGCGCRGPGGGAGAAPVLLALLVARRRRAARAAPSVSHAA
jgi:hypothetical protein